MDRGAEKLGYRPEIDGLRAIAVLAVVLFHARLGAPRAGYAGVDVFFVISGFLISRLIAQELGRTDRFSMLAFYERRIRRLFPALSAMVLATLALGWWQLPPSELVALVRSAFAALAFFSNLHFSRLAGYFQPDAETQPLLHTWSLGVEEQFYILAPFVIFALLKLGQGWQRVLLGGLVAASLGFAVLMPFSWREAGFFWPQARAYELLLGVALGLKLVPLPQSQRARAALGAAGLALVLAAVFALPSGLLFPGLFALLPCLGAAMVIAASEGGAVPGLAGAVLRARSMRFFGKISYSLYLWHWPLLVFAFLCRGVPLAPYEAVAVILVAVGLSWFSYRFIEQPARHGVRNRIASVFLPAAVMILAGGLASWGVVQHQGFPARFGVPMERFMAAATQPVRAAPECSGGVCRLGAPVAAITFVFWGDSHARVMAPEVSDIAREAGQGGILLIRDGCPPLLDEAGKSLTPSRKCLALSGQLDTLLSANPGIKVAIAARWALYAEASPFGEETGLEAHPLVSGGLEANHRAFEAALARTLAHLRKRGADVRLVGPVPEQGRDIPATLARRLMRGQAGDLFVHRERFEARQRAVLGALNNAQTQGFAVAYPHEALCNAQACRASIDGLPLYADDDHLNARGGAQIRAVLAQALK